MLAVDTTESNPLRHLNQPKALSEEEEFRQIEQRVTNRMEELMANLKSSTIKIIQDELKPRGASHLN